MTDKLEPCPFCGCDEVAPSLPPTPWVMICGECGAEGPYADTRKEAIALWQSRTSPDKDRIEALEGALAPFAAMGRVMERRAMVTFGKNVPDSEIVSESSGEAGQGILVMGHFRDAAALLPKASSWGGIYTPIRATLTPTASETSK